MNTQVVLAIVILLMAMPGSTLDKSDKPQPKELEEIGQQLTELYLRGYRWPQRKKVENCWKSDELPNIALDFHDFEMTDNPKVTAQILAQQKQNTLKIDDYKIVTRGVVLKRKNINLDFAENQQFIFQFMIELPGSGKKPNYVGCKRVDERDIVSSCLQPTVVETLAEAYIFEISGDVLLANSTNFQLRGMASSEKPSYSAILGLYEPERFNLIKSECYLDSN